VTIDSALPLKAHVPTFVIGTHNALEYHFYQNQTIRGWVIAISISKDKPNCGSWSRSECGWLLKSSHLFSLMKVASLLKFSQRFNM